MLLTLVIFSIIFYLSLVKPIWGLIAFFVVICSVPLDVMGAGNLGTATKIGGLSLAAGYLLRVLLIDAKLDFKPIFASSFFFLMLWRLFEASRSEGLAASYWIKGVSNLPELVLTVLLFFVMVLIVANIIKTKSDVVLMKQWMVLGISISALYSCLIVIGIVDPLPEAASNYNVFARVSGLRNNPNDFIAFNGLAIGLHLPVVLHAISKKDFHYDKTCVFNILLLMLLIYGQLMSGSRTGLVMIGGVFLTYLFLERRSVNFKNIFLFVFLFVFLLIFSILLGLIDIKVVLHIFNLPFLSNIFFDQSFTLDASTLHRLERQGVVLEMIRDYPLAGIGLGNYEIFMGDVLGYGSSSHNFYVETLGEQGFIGLGLILTLITVTFGNLLLARKAWIREQNNKMLMATNGFILALTGLCIERFFSSAEVTTKLLYILFAISYVVYKISKERRKLNNSLTVIE